MTTLQTEFDETNSTMSNLTVDLDTIDSYNFSFADLKFEKFGQFLDYTVKDSSGAAVDKSQTINLTDTQSLDYVLTVSDNISYNTDGLFVSNTTSTYDYHFKITSTRTTINPPTLERTISNGPSYLVVKGKNSDWSCGVPASLDGINLKYYNKNTKKYETLNLGNAFPITKTGKLNGTNNYLTMSNDYGKLTVSCSVIHDTKDVYGMPIGLSVDSSKKLYFTISSTNGYVSTGTAARTPTITYEFEDANGKTWTHSISHNFKYADYKDVAQYKYSDFVNGTLRRLLKI